MKSYTLNTVLSARTDKFVHHGRHIGLYLRSVNANNILRSYIRYKSRNLLKLSNMFLLS